jgi:hypothetical protein
VHTNLDTRWRDVDHGTGTATILVTPRSLESGPEK